jgi:hypothetical protein
MASLACYFSAPLTFLFASVFLWAALDSLIGKVPIPIFANLPGWTSSCVYLLLAIVGIRMSWLAVASYHGWWERYTLDEFGVAVALPDGSETKFLGARSLTVKCLPLF